MQEFWAGSSGMNGKTLGDSTVKKKRKTIGDSFEIRMQTMADSFQVMAGAMAPSTSGSVDASIAMMIDDHFKALMQRQDEQLQQMQNQYLADLIAALQNK
ncbi:hypothetical protein PF005_g7857 [Phytophthora fragariae]|uniref:Uncharacterized protein n=1 Tax=Phytophthora fragariae TaxID=53985 RepID=A0A6A3IXE5_9STRA|nr:hypothetical protein PF011_g19965 [Phytophthora fragariae]KAE9219507.1 hypothetical protein PF005_g7857 [Phytophthora fragariae]